MTRDRTSRDMTPGQKRDGWGHGRGCGWGRRHGCGQARCDPTRPDMTREMTQDMRGHDRMSRDVPPSKKKHKGTKTKKPTPDRLEPGICGRTRTGPTHKGGTRSAATNFVWTKCPDSRFALAGGRSCERPDGKFPCHAYTGWVQCSAVQAGAAADGWEGDAVPYLVATRREGGRLAREGQTKA